MLKGRCFKLFVISPLNVCSGVKSKSAKAKKWRDSALMRRFFDSYAQEKQFDPLNPEIWYSLKLSELLDREVEFNPSRPSSFIHRYTN